MKMIVSTAALIVVFTGLYVSKENKHTSVLEKQNSTEVEKTVKKFWNAVESKDYVAFSNIISDKPDDFYKDCSSEPKLSDSIDSKKNNVGIVIKQDSKDKFKDFDSVKLDSIFKQTLESFINNRVVLIEITKIIQTKSEAIVTVKYGNNNFTIFDENMLLIKDKGNWKIFSIVPSSILENAPNYKLFAKKPECHSK